MSDYGLFSQCPNCGKLYREIARHWKQSNCKYPQLSKEQREIITGSLMGDANLNKRSKNPILKWQMISKDYLEYLSNEKFPLLTLEVNKMKSAKESYKQTNVYHGNHERYSDLYGLWTRALPELKEFNYWYQGKNNKTFPKDIFLSSKVFKHWYVQDGNYSNNTISISLSKEYKETDKIKSIFDNSPIPDPDRHDKIEYIEKGTQKQRQQYNIAWNIIKTQEIFDIISNPLPGFEYKWPNNST